MGEVLLEVTRGSLVENIVRGSIAVIGTDNTLIAHAGDPDYYTYMRSTAKPLQASVAVESGALESCPILKAGHHGSKNSGSEEFLQIVKPRLTLISAGIENRYGHPHEETLERLQEIGSEVLSTQECGAITLRSDGRKIKVHKYL